MSLWSMAKENFSGYIFYWSKIIGVHTTCGSTLELHRSTFTPKGWLNVEGLVPPATTKLMDGYYPELELQLYHYYFIKVSNSKSTKVQLPKVYTGFSCLWKRSWMLLLKLEPVLTHGWVTSLKQQEQKRHGEILTGLGSEVKIVLIPLESNGKINIFQGNHLCVLQ